MMPAGIRVRRERGAGGSMAMPAARDDDGPQAVAKVCKFFRMGAKREARGRGEGARQAERRESNIL